MKILTINDLHKFCEEQIANGNGDKKIMLHCDSNGYKSLVSDFRPAEAVFGDEYGEFCVYNIPNVMKDQPLSDFVVLG